MDGGRLKGRIVLAGGSGFVGSHLESFLVDEGYEVVVLSRSPRSGGKSGCRVVQWDGKSVGEWASELDGAVAVVNLSGASISKRWTDEYKKVLYFSRIQPTQAIAEALKVVTGEKPVWVNFSAVGCYGDQGDRSLSSASPAGTGFMADLCVAWESACKDAELPDIRRVILRLGVVLANDGGALPMLLKLAKVGLGGPAGSGEQYMSWIHIKDLCRMVLWAIEGEVDGTMNACAPNPVTNKRFMSSLREKLVRPPVPGVPAGLLRLGTSLVGMEAEVILGGQRVYPVVAESRGFWFEFDELDSAIDDLVH